MSVDGYIGNATPQRLHHGWDKLVNCPDSVVAKLGGRLGGLAEVVGLGATVDFEVMPDDLGTRGTGRLMVKGDSTIHTQFLTAGLADEIQLAIAPFFVGDAAAPRFVLPGTYPSDPGHRMTLDQCRLAGDVALLRLLPRQQPGATTV
jgi:riboflavin biosynthesis pyrimidine reductase